MEKKDGGGSDGSHPLVLYLLETLESQSFVFTTMGSRKTQRSKGCRKALAPSHSPPPPPTPTLEALIIQIDAPQVLKLPRLKSLYYLLTHLSVNIPICCSSDDAASNYWSMNGFKITFTTIHNLCSTMFNELCKRFKDLSDVFARRDLGESSLHSDMWGTAKELTLLLRCCIVSLNLLGSDQSLLFQKCRVLLTILSRFCSQGLSEGSEKNAFSFKKSVSCGHTCSEGGYATSICEDFVASFHFIEPSDPFLPVSCSLLEVFADELLVHKPLREYFMLIDSVSSASEMLFMCHSSPGHIGSVLEVLSSHFLLSVCDEQACEIFLNRLFWLHQKDFRVPELSLTAAISLLQNPIMLSAPKIFQAHIVSLVSEATIIDLDPENTRPNVGLMNCYLSLFETSVIFYDRHISSLQIDGHPIGFKDSFIKSSTSDGGFQLSFESYIPSVMRNKMNGLITQLENSWNSYLSNRFSRTKLDLVTSAVTFVKENQYILDKSCRDDIVLILSHMIPEALSGDDSDTELHKEGDASLQDTYLLASILKLISSSMLQAIWCISHSGNPGCLKTFKDLSSCKEYEYILGIIANFGRYNIHLPISKCLSHVMDHSTRHKDSKMMLLHFSGMLSISLAIGVDFVVKGCTLAMMIILNLFIFEEGNLDALRPLLVSKVESFSSGISSGNIQRVLVEQNSSQMVASKFQKVQTLYLSTDLLPSSCSGNKDGQEEMSGNANASILNNMDCVVGIEEKTEETCNGKIFLNCLLEGSKEPSDLDDLAGFIECKEGKDYSNWLRDRKRYRKWKCAKMAVLRWEKKKTIWKFVKGRKS